MVRRFICCKFAEEVDDDGVQSHFDGLAALAERSELVKNYQAVKTIPDDFGRPAEYDAIHTLDFDSVDSLVAFLDEAEHKKFLEEHEGLWSDMLVLNGVEEAP